MTTENRPIQIDVGQILRVKNPALARLLPGVAVDRLRKLVHQKEINDLLRDFGHLPTMEFVAACLDRMGLRYRCDGIEALDPKGRYIFASNHPFGGVDGLMLSDEVYRHLGQVRVVVNDLLMNLTPLSPIFVPVNKHGRQNPAYARLYNEAFESDMQIITFPAGLCSRRTKGRVEDLPWKSNFVRRAVASRRDVVPVYFEGRLSNFFYRLSAWRTALHIPVNIEMLWLVDEMFRQQGSQITIRMGAPVSWLQMADGTPPQVWTEEIRRRVYGMKTESF